MRLRRFWEDTRGATAIEYGLIVGMIFLAIVTAITNFATKTGNMYNYISNNMKGN